jgi:hypothetical protein
MAKLELTEEQKNFRLDSYTLNRQFTYWLAKSKCMWNLRTTNKEYEKLRKDYDHATAFEKLKIEMFNLGLK